MKTPAWMTEEEKPRAEEAALQKTQQDIRRGKLQTPRAVGPLPLDREQAIQELSQEQSALARLSPWRSRWPEVADYDRRIGELEQRRVALETEMQTARDQLTAAVDADRRSLAAWTIEGGERPRPEAPAIEERIRDLEAEHDATALVIASVIQDKVEYVAKHRRRLTRDAGKATEQARDRYLELIDQVEQAREELIALRATAVWAALFPSSTLTSSPPSHVLVGARLSVQERHLPGFKGQLIAPNMFALLREDSQHFAAAITIEQAAEISGVSKTALTGREAIWHDRKAEYEIQQRENEAARRRFKEEWGYDLPEYSG